MLIDSDDDGANVDGDDDSDNDDNDDNVDGDDDSDDDDIGSD